MLELSQEFAFPTRGEISVLRRISHRCGSRVQASRSRAWPGQKDSFGVRNMFEPFRAGLRAWLPQTPN